MTRVEALGIYIQEKVETSDVESLLTFVQKTNAEQKVILQEFIDQKKVQITKTLAQMDQAKTQTQDQFNSLTNVS